MYRSQQRPRDEGPLDGARGRVLVSRDRMPTPRVLPIAEFAQEVLSGGTAKLTPEERLAKFGTTVIPIPVPLEPGETKQQYEAAFVAWLATRSITPESLRTHKDANRERSIRCSYAVYKAKAFHAKWQRQAVVEDELEEGEEREGVDEETEPPNMKDLPREVLNATKVVDLEAYKKEVQSGKFVKLSMMSFVEKKRLFGSPVVPIYVPLARGESFKQYEYRFGEWLYTKKNMTIDELVNHKVRMLERYMRMEFASANAKDEERFEPGRLSKRAKDFPGDGGSPPKRVKEDGNQATITTDRHPVDTDIANAPGPIAHSQEGVGTIERSGHELPPPPERPPASAASPAQDLTRGRLPPKDVMLAIRALPIADYARELVGRKLTPSERLKKFGSSVAPIPVPLAHGQSEAQFEERLHEYLVKLKGTTLEHLRADPNTNRERTARIAFANVATNAWIKESKWEPDRKEPKTHELSDDEDCAEQPRDVLTVKKHIELDQYQWWLHTQFCSKLKTMSAAEKTERFGIPILPIFVALARGESIQQYEDMFVEWLQRVHHTKLAELQAHPDKLRERRYRRMFTSLNAMGTEKFRAEPSQEPSTSRVKQCAEAQPSESKVSIDDTTCRKQANGNRSGGCECHDCLLRGMRRLRDRIKKLECWRASLTSPSSDSTPMQLKMVADLTAEVSDDSAGSRETSLDAVGNRLLDDYDDVNDLVVMNAMVLSASTVRLCVDLNASDIREAVRLYDESCEYQQLINEEDVRRGCALAVLVVYMWRESPRELELMLATATGKDVPYIADASHRRCARLLRDVAAANDQKHGHVSKCEKDAFQNEHSHGKTSNRDTRRLYVQLKQEFATIVQFMVETRVAKWQTRWV